MNKTLVILLSILLVQVGFSQSKKISEKEISILLKKSGSCLMELECDQSLNLAKKALNEAYKTENNLLIAKAYNIIGLNFEEFSDFQKAIGFYKRGLKYANKTSNDSIKDWLHGNLGNIYTYRNIDFNLGIQHYKKNLLYAQKIKSNYEIMYSYLNIANAYFSIGKFKNGLPYLMNAKKLVENSDEIEAQITFNSLFGHYFSHVNNFLKAENHYNKALEICKKDKPKIIDGTAMELYDDIANMNYRKGDYKKAYEFQLQYNKLKEDYYNAERTHAVKTVGISVEMDEYKREIEKIESDRNLKIQNLKQSNTVIILFVIILIILTVLLFTFYRNNSYKNKINLQLANTNERLKVAKEKAEDATKIKSQFVSTITHELRTPLYGVVGITNMIVDEHKELANSPYLNSLKYSAKYLLSLVNDVLQINKIEENKIVLEEMAFNVSDEIHSIVNSLQFIAEKNKNKLTCIIDSKIPEYLIGDKLRLSQIFMNLISNALKFTKKGEVIVIADLVDKKDNIYFIQFQIKDNGVGIAKADQDKIFEKFIQVGRREEDYQGTGLGLSIVKKLVELFGGEIQLESTEGEGTTFSFTIGFEEDTFKFDKFIGDFDVDLSNNQIYKILVVEDNAINQLITKKILENNNLASKIVNDGLEAIKLVKKETFDVILMDINMPVISGFETSRKIRELGITTPIIALTAFEKEEVIEEVIASGMNDIIVKPFDPSKLFQIINRQIQKNKLN